MKDLIFASREGFRGGGSFIYIYIYSLLLPRRNEEEGKKAIRGDISALQISFSIYVLIKSPRRGAGVCRLCQTVKLIALPSIRVSNQT